MQLFVYPGRAAKTPICAPSLKSVFVSGMQMSERLPQMAPVREGLPRELSACATAPASDWPSALVSWS